MVGLGLGLCTSRPRTVPKVLERLRGRARRTAPAGRCRHPGHRRTFLGQALGLFVGSRVRRTLPHGSVSTVDRAGGALRGCSACSSRCGCCCRRSREVPDWPARQARTSAIAKAIDRAVPDRLLTRWTRSASWSATTLPEVFAGLEAAPDVPAPPTSILVSSTVNQHATQGTYRVEAPACGRLQEGTGFAVDQDLVVTNAHVVAGADESRCSGEDGEVLATEVVAFDPLRDIAALRIDQADVSQPLTLGEPSVGDQGAVFGHPGGGDLRAAPFLVATGCRPRARTSTATRRSCGMCSCSRRRCNRATRGLRSSATTARWSGWPSQSHPTARRWRYALTSDELNAVLSGPLAARVSTGDCLR